MLGSDIHALVGITRLQCSLRQQKNDRKVEQLMLRRMLRTYLRITHRGQPAVLRAIQKLNLPRLIPVKTRTGLIIDVEWEDWAGLFLLRHGCLEPYTSELIVSLLNPGDVVVDVGAHIGYMSLISAQRVGAEGKILSIEPQPHNCDKLLEAAIQNKLENISVYCAAAGSSAGEVKLVPQSRQDHSTLSLLKDQSDSTFGFTVPVLTVEHVTRSAKVSRVDLIKLDVEGYELEVLRGVDWNGPCRPKHLIVEVLSETEEERSRSRELLAYMASKGYVARDVCRNPVNDNMSQIENNIWYSES